MGSDVGIKATGHGRGRPRARQTGEEAPMGCEKREANRTKKKKTNCLPARLRKNRIKPGPPRPKGVYALETEKDNRSAQLGEVENDRSMGKAES